MRRTGATIVALALVLVLVLAAVAACHETRSGDGQDVGDEPELLAAAAVARVTKDNSFGGPLSFERVNVVDRLGTPSTDGTVLVPDAAPHLQPETRVAIEDALSPHTVVWVKSLTDVIGTGSLPTAADTGVVLTLAKPEINGDAAHITSMLWCGNACGVGGTHTLERRRGEWVVTGTTGPGFIA